MAYLKFLSATLTQTSLWFLKATVLWPQSDKLKQNCVCITISSVSIPLSRFPSLMNTTPGHLNNWTYRPAAL